MVSNEGSASSSFVPAAIVYLGISSTWHALQLYRKRSLFPWATAVWAGLSYDLGRYRLEIRSPVSPRTKVMTSSTATGSLAQANCGIRSRSSHAFRSSLVFR